MRLRASAPDKAAPPGAPAVRLDGVRKVYGRGDGAVVALDDVTARFDRGTFTAVMGPSGSGKSTFLHWRPGLDRPTSGHGPARRRRARRAERGRAAPSCGASASASSSRPSTCCPSLTVAQNIDLPAAPAGRRAGPGLAARDRGPRRARRPRCATGPAELSGGQQQRVAIARALVTRPEVVFADEPTGALDTRTGREILALLRHVVDDLGQTVVMVTHDPVAAAHADRVLFLADGAGRRHARGADAEQVAERMTHLGD